MASPWRMTRSRHGIASWRRRSGVWRLPLGRPGPLAHSRQARRTQRLCQRWAAITAGVSPAEMWRRKDWVPYRWLRCPRMPYRAMAKMRVGRWRDPPFSLLMLG